MESLVPVFLAGFAAGMVDGALGMGFGPTSSSILLGAGLSPASASTTVNLAKVATGLAAGAAHWRFGNIDRRTVLRLAVPGAAGALMGVTVLASVDGARLKPVLAALLLVVAVRMLLRFSRALPVRVDDSQHERGEAPPYDHRGIAVAATAGGVTNGLIGAWGPVVTPFLLHRGLAPRWAIGSANTAEVAVAVVASGSLLATLRGDGVDVGTVLAMLAGGVVAAPLAAWLIRFIPARGLGVAVGALLCLTNVRELAGWAELGAVRWAAYALVAAAGAWAALRPRLAGTPPVDEGGDAVLRPARLAGHGA